MPDAWSMDYISSIWRKIEAESQNHSIFQSWDWISCWLEISKKNVQPIIFKSNGKAVGICFIGFGQSFDLRIFSFKTVFPFQTGNPAIDELCTEYNAILSLPEYIETVHLKLIDFLIKHKRLKKYQRILLNNISEKNIEFYQKSALDNDLNLKIFKTTPSAQINLEHLRQNNLPYDYHFSKSLKKDIRRSEKLYTEKYGSLTIERPDNATQAHNWFQELGKLHKKKFEAQKGSSFWDYPEIVRMQRAFLNRKFSSGVVEIVRLCAGTTPIGYLYNFVYRNVIYFYLSGFRFEDDNRLKPGLLSHNYLIQQHYNNDINIYDFMAGDQKYKYRMAQEGETQYHLYLDKKTFKHNCINAIGSFKKIFKNHKL